MSQGIFRSEAMDMTMTQRHHSAVSPAFWRAYGVTMRPYLMFVSGITGIAGLSFVREAPGMRLALIGIASFLSYGFGQALTDCFQTDTDTLSAPYRPLTQGVITKPQVFAVSLAGLALCVAAFAAFNPWNILLGLMAGAGLATYTPFKRMWWAGPFYNAWIVAVLGAMALAGGSGELVPLLDRSFLFVLFTIFFGYANFVLAGYFKDIAADAATAYRTLPVVFGRKAAAITSDVFAILAFVFFLGFGLLQDSPTLLPLLFGTAALLSAAVGQIRLHRTTTDREAHRAISFTVHSYLLLLSGVAAARQPSWSLFLLAYLGAYALVIRFRPEKSQI